MACIDDVIDFVENMFPIDNAMDFDNPGLLVGDSERELKGVLLTLDCNMASVNYAIENGCNLIIAHHPLIFGGIHSVTNETATGRIITELIKNDISLYACHTQLDCTDEFGNLEIARLIGGTDAYKLDDAPIGVVFDLERRVSLEEFAQTVKSGLDCSGVVSMNSPEETVSRVFVQGGAFDEDNIPFILNDSDIDLVISGEIKHHLCVLLEEEGISTLIVGHNASERVYLPKLKNVLDEQFNDTDIFVYFGKERAFK